MPTSKKSDERIGRAKDIIKLLKKKYPHAACSLDWKTPHQLLVATILSAQCTDVRVNIVTKDLFKKYKTVRDFAEAEPDKFEQDIRSTGFYKQKTKSVLATSKLILEKFNGNVPDTMDDLTSLPGVARKTANVILGTAYHKNEGICVDTHVGRVAIRLGLITSTANSKDAVKIEQELMSLVPKNDWTWFSHSLVLLGREICQARNPSHKICPINALCPSATV